MLSKLEAWNQNNLEKIDFLEKKRRFLQVQKTSSTNFNREQREFFEVMAKQDSDQAKELDRQVRLHEDVSEILQKFVKTQEVWNRSLTRQKLIETIRQRVQHEGHQAIDTAVCFALGRLKLDPDYENLDYEEEIEEGYDIEQLRDEDEWVVFNRGSLRQLCIFETVLKCLEKHSKIDKVIFQDPRFQDDDRIFLGMRGYAVIPYPKGGQDRGSLIRKDYGGIDPKVLQHISSSTFLFTPFMDFVPNIAAVVQGEPGLYLGNDLMHTAMERSDLHDPDNIQGAETWHRMRDLQDIVKKSDWYDTPLNDTEVHECVKLWLMWPVNPHDQAAVARVQARWAHRLANFDHVIINSLNNPESLRQFNVLCEDPEFLREAEAYFEKFKYSMQRSITFAVWRSGPKSSHSKLHQPASCAQGLSQTSIAPSSSQK